MAISLYFKYNFLLHNKLIIYEMKKLDLFTDQFLSEPRLTLDILNELVETNQVADKEMYQSGTFLFMEVYENDATKELLSKVIKDLDEYKKVNAEYYTTDETTQISLCLLQAYHNQEFGNYKEIKWDYNSETFVFAEEFDED